MYPVKLEALAIKTEATQNTAVVPAATDFMLVQDASVKVVQEFLPREYKHLSLDKLAHVLGSVYVDITFKTELKASGTPGTAYVPLGAALQASGMSETVAAGSVTYAPVSVPASANYFSPGKSATIEYYDGATLTKTGLKRIIKGCVASGGPKIVLEAGKIGMYEFSFRGLYAAVTDAVCPAVTYLAQLPAKVQSATFSLHAFAAVIAKLEVDFGNAVANRTDMNSADGIKGFSIIDHDPKGSCDPEGESVATFDIFDKMRTGAEAAMSVVVGATAGNITTITCPKTQILVPDPADRNGIRTYQTPLKFNQSTGDDWISIVLT